MEDGKTSSSLKLVESDYTNAIDWIAIVILIRLKQKN